MKVPIVVAYLMYSGSEFQTEGHLAAYSPHLSYAKIKYVQLICSASFRLIVAATEIKNENNGQTADVGPFFLSTIANTLYP